MPVDLVSSSAMTVSTASAEASVSSSGNQTTQPTAATSTTIKKKRNLPGMPDPDAEVIALSPKTLMATNRFVCEICNKGFQRDQNLQLHRRGHNLPWKLRQRSSKEVRKRVYVCPEPSCVHHDPLRALGDLTGIKKHFCRKHGEKKWKCDKCSKKYAVQSDWKAHLKICGTREYKCDCGTLFSRRDSFITHRAFCDALAEESARAQTGANPNSEDEPNIQTVDSPQPPPPPTPSLPPSSVAPATALEVLPLQTELPDDPTPILEEAGTANPCMNRNCSGSSNSSSSNGSTTSSVFASLFASSNTSTNLQPHQTPAFSDLIRAMSRSDHSTDLQQPSSVEPVSLCLSTATASSIFGTAGQERRQFASPPQPAMSATALLQKAAQMGATATNASLLRGFGLVSSSSSPSVQQIEPDRVAAGLGLGLPCDEGAGLKELMMGSSSSVFGPKQTTLDFLGLGMAAGGSPAGGLSALITSIGGGGGGLDVGAAASFRAGDFAGKEMGRSS